MFSQSLKYKHITLIVGILNMFNKFMFPRNFSELKCIVYLQSFLLYYKYFVLFHFFDVSIFDSSFMFLRIFIKPPPQRGWCYLFHSICATIYTVKKVRGFPVSRRDVTYSRRGGVLVSDIPTEDGKISTLFYSVSKFLFKHKL